MFLEVKFHDNDFSRDIEKSVQQIFEWVNDDIDSHNVINQRSTIEAFLYLHETGILKQMIEKLTIAFALCHDVEWATRGLYNRDSSSRRRIKPIMEDVPRFERYFDGMELAFHRNSKFALEWQNNEHVYLDLHTGKHGTF